MRRARVGSRRPKSKLGDLGVPQEAAIDALDNLDHRTAPRWHETAHRRPIVFETVIWHVGCQQPEEAARRIRPGQAFASPQVGHDPDVPSSAISVSGSTGFHGLLRCTP